MNGSVLMLIIIAILVAGGVLAYVTSARQQRRDRLMSVITRDKNAGAGGGDESKDKQLARQRADIAKKLKQAGQEEEKKKDKTTIREKMIQAGIEAPVSRYWLGSLAAAVVVWGLTSTMTSWPQIAVILVSFTAFMGLPRFFLNWKAARRQKKFLEELPDALDATVRLLQAGMPMSEAIAMVAREYTGPLREEMMRIYENQKIGVPLGEAAYQTAKRIPLTEVHMFATALQIQSETGSSLSEVLGNLSQVIRSRFRLKRKVKALSSEAKSSAAIIGALPIIVATGLYFVNRSYIEVLFDTRQGHFVLAGAIAWMCVGILVMRQMINFKI
ncbi:MAG: type II secretion protein F [Alphaproteobacteria bacterium]|nr:type II secretion protein F [Alphaproteobacteria bacterium]